MNSSQSFLSTVVARARAYLDEPSVDAKYPDDFIIRHALSSALQDVYSRIHMSADNPVLCRHVFDIDPDIREYQLPPCIGELWEITVRDADTNRLLADAIPRSHFSPAGSGWEIQGNLLVLGLNEIKATTDVEILYTHNGDMRCHYSSTGELTDEDGVHTLKLGTPTLGEIDRRVNGYAGQTLKIIPASGPIEERVIGSSYYDSGDWYVTLRSPLTETTVPTGGETVVYEIAPPLHESMTEAVATACALRVGAYKKISESAMAMIQMEYRKSIKTCKDNVAFMQMRVPKRFQRDTRDNPEFRKFTPWVMG